MKPIRFRGQLNRRGRKWVKMSRRSLVRGMMAALTPDPIKWLSLKVRIGAREGTILAISEPREFNEARQ